MICSTAGISIKNNVFEKKITRNRFLEDECIYRHVETTPSRWGGADFYFHPQRGGGLTISAHFCLISPKFLSISTQRSPPRGGRLYLSPPPISTSLGIYMGVGGKYESLTLSGSLLFAA